MAEAVEADAEAEVEVVVEVLRVLVGLGSAAWLGAGEVTRKWETGVVEVGGACPSSPVSLWVRSLSDCGLPELHQLFHSECVAHPHSSLSQSCLTGHWFLC